MSYRNQPERELTAVEMVRKEMGAELRAANERAEKAEREVKIWKTQHEHSSRLAASEGAHRRELQNKLIKVEEQLAWAGYHHQAPTFAECVAMMYQDLKQARDDRDAMQGLARKAERERDEAVRLFEQERREVKRWQSLSIEIEEEAIKITTERDTLCAQVDALTKERDDLAQFRLEVYDELNACKETMLESQKAMKLSHWANEILKRNLKETEQERDAATAQVEALTKEREAAHAELEDLGAPDNRCCGYPLNQQQAELSLVERIAIIGNRLAEAENTATAQVEMLAGVVREARSLLRGEQESPYDLTIYGGPNGGMNVVRIERIIQQTDKALSSLPHAVERWAKMQAVCEAAKVAKNALDPCQKMTTSGLFAAFQRLRDALDDLAKVVG